MANAIRGNTPAKSANRHIGDSFVMSGTSRRRPEHGLPRAFAPSSRLGNGPHHPRRGRRTLRDSWLARRSDGRRGASSSSGRGDAPRREPWSTGRGSSVAPDRALERTPTMPDLGPKRIAEFIKPFRVEPGRKVRLPRDFDPASVTRQTTKGEKKELLSEGIEFLAEYQA